MREDRGSAGDGIDEGLSSGSYRDPMLFVEGLSALAVLEMERWPDAWLHDAVAIGGDRLAHQGVALIYGPARGEHGTLAATARALAAARILRSRSGG